VLLLQIATARRVWAKLSSEIEFPLTFMGAFSYLDLHMHGCRPVMFLDRLSFLSVPILCCCGLLDEAGHIFFFF
jgi:hypothetical protein